MISFLRRRSSKNRHGCVWRRTISRGPRGVLRRSEPLEGIYGRFPSVDPVVVRARVPYLGKIYIEKKPLEPKLTLNRSKSVKKSHSTQRKRRWNSGKRFLL